MSFTENIYLLQFKLYFKIMQLNACWYTECINIFCFALPVLSAVVMAGFELTVYALILYLVIVCLIYHFYRRADRRSSRIASIRS